MEDILDLADSLSQFWYQKAIVLWDLNDNTHSHNPLSQKVADLLMDFGLVDFRQNINSAGGSNTGNVVLEEGRQIFGRKVGRLQHGGKKVREEVYGALFLLG